jgi:hypothetical protein
VVMARSHIAVHEEGSRLSDNDRGGNSAQLGNWIRHNYGRRDQEHMTRSKCKRVRAAEDILAKYAENRELKRLLDAAVGPHASKREREAVLVTALEGIGKKLGVGEYAPSVMAGALA